MSGAPIINVKSARVFSDWLDASEDPTALPAEYRGTMAQDFARVAKVAEEAGEAIDAFIGATGQNRRKGVCKRFDDVYDELADCVLTGIYALLHFMNEDDVVTIIQARQHTHHDRIGLKWVVE